VSRRQFGDGVGRTVEWVASLETGRITNPPADVRAAAARTLGESESTLFEGFPPSQREWQEYRQSLVAAAHARGLSGSGIAADYGLSRSAVYADLAELGLPARQTLIDFDRNDGKISLSAYAQKRGLTYSTLRKAIDAGVLRVDIERVDHGLPPRYYENRVDEAQLDEALKRLPPCGFEGCTKPALGPSGGCSGPHAGALETRGDWWSSDEGQRFLRAYTAGQITPACWLCGAEKQGMARAHVARAWREDRRLVCRDCRPLWITALITARDRAEAAATPMDALEAALEVAKTFESDFRTQHPRRGYPRPLAIDLLIEALYIGRRLSEMQVTNLLNRAIREQRVGVTGVGEELNGLYVRTRRRRSKIKRREAANSDPPVGILTPLY
jgi:hypothetical protein